MKTLLKLVGVWWISLSVLPAQSETRVVKFRVLCQEHVKGVLKGFVAGTTVKKQEVEFLSGGFGPQLGGKFADGKVRFYAEMPGPDGKPVPTVVGEGDLVASPMQMFFLLPQTRPNAPIYRVMAFPDEEKAFPMGATRVVNLAPMEIRLTLAGIDQPAIKAGGVAVYPQSKVVDEWNMFSARIDIYAEKKWVPAVTQSWKASNRKRELVIFQVDLATQTPTIRMYQDIPPWRETKLPGSGVP
jgi:hypothetical protein